MGVVHTKEQKAFIVCRLAAFETPRDVALAFATRFPDTACNEADVLATDPRVVVVAPELHELFAKERGRILADPAAAPFAEQRARLIVLSRQAERCEADNRPADTRAIFRQIAEETGGAGSSKNGAGPELPPVVGITRTIIDPVVQE